MTDSRDMQEAFDQFCNDQPASSVIDWLLESLAGDEDWLAHHMTREQKQDLGQLAGRLKTHLTEEYLKRNEEGKQQLLYVVGDQYHPLQGFMSWTEEPNVPDTLDQDNTSTGNNACTLQELTSATEKLPRRRLGHAGVKRRLLRTRKLKEKWRAWP